MPWKNNALRRCVHWPIYSIGCAAIVTSLPLRSQRVAYVFRRHNIQQTAEQNIEMARYKSVEQPATPAVPGVVTRARTAKVSPANVIAVVYEPQASGKWKHNKHTVIW